jgi:CBS domain-containing protein
MLVKTLLESKPKEVITIGREASVDEAMNSLISHKIGCLPVVNDQGTLVGIVSDRDIFKKVHESKGDYHSMKVSDLMSSELIIGVPEDSLEYIAGIMDKNWIQHVPILDGDRLVGLVSARDIIRTEASRTRIENRYLRMYLEGMGTRDMSADS